MSSPDSPETPGAGRRHFLTTAATGLASVPLGRGAAADVPVVHQSRQTQEVAAVFPPLQQIEAGVLSVGYAELGPTDGTVVILLHGWPYDIHSYADVAPILAASGYRVIVPYLRGYGSTRFLSGSTLRNGQQSALAVDVLKLMDAL